MQGRSHPVPETFPALIDLVVGAHGDKVFLPRRHSGGGGSVTFAQLRRDVRRLAAGLLARGIRRGDRVALVAENSYAWILSDLAVTYIGAIDVPRGADTAPRELEQILSHSGCRLALAETDEAVRDLCELQDSLPALEDVVSMAETCAVEGVTTIHEMMAQVDEDETHGAVNVAAAEVDPSDPLTIVYTSGTTANPKGVVLTHSNVLSNVTAVTKVLHASPEDVFLSVLPAWHVYERIFDYLALSCGAELVYTSRHKIKEDLATVQPTVFAAVPRIWENIHDSIVNRCEKLTGLKGRLIRGALRNSRKVGSGRANALERALNRLYRATLLRPIRRFTGGNIRIAVSGGGALPSHVDDFLLGIGLPLLNGYGLTETSPVVCVRPPEDNRVGTIGPPLEQTEVEIRDTEGRVLPVGEIGLLWVRGPQVMQGYYKNPETTSLVLTPDGWFNSGDLARVDEHGHFSITGRAKDTIVLAGGENVEPEPVEICIKSSGIVDQAVVLGQDQKTLGAILIPTPEILEQRIPRSEWGERDGELTGEKVLNLYRQELNRTLTRAAGFRPCEKVARFRVRLEPMTVENGLLTPTMKVKRHEVNRQMSGLIADLWK